MNRRLLFLITLFVIGSALCGYLAWRESQRAKIVIDWSTASEIDTIGFYIYRSEIPDKGYVRVNSEIIPSAQDSLTGSHYSYTDNDVTPGILYYYILEDVNMDGQAARSKPIEIEAQSNYWGYLILCLVSSGIVVLLLVNRTLFPALSINRGTENN